MSGKVNIYSDQWVDIVFQNKNQKYGAYEMRKTSSKRHAKALGIAITFFLLAILSPILINKITSYMKRDQDTTVRVLTKINMEKPKEKEIPKIAPPPPPEVRNQIKFVPPVIKPDDQVPEEKVVLNEDLNKSKAAISNVDVKGNTDDVAAPVVAVTQTVEVEEPITFAEQMPEFEGGETAMSKFLQSNINYPVVASENGVQGLVIVKFVVDKDGKISQVQVVRGIGSGCDEEAIRVVRKMPHWKPGKQGGRTVPVWYTLPVRFQMQQ